jgi:uncharacterized protein
VSADPTPDGEAVIGRVETVTVWPVKSMGGGSAADGVLAGPRGLAGDRAVALVDRRPLRNGRVLSARNLPGILRWSACWDDDPDGPAVTAPDGTAVRWSDPELPGLLVADLGVPVDRAPPGAYSDLADSVLVTTRATHRAVEQGFGQPVDLRRFRTNLHLDLSAPAFAEAGWEGRRLVVGEVVLQLLHPCRRCTIPTWQPDGRSRDPDLLRWFLQEAAGVFGINARVVRPGRLHVEDPVRLED